LIDLFVGGLVDWWWIRWGFGLLVAKLIAGVGCWVLSGGLVGDLLGDGLMICW
jgi:hypothetical protein